MVISSTAWGTNSWIDNSELVWVTATVSGIVTDAVLYQIYTDNAYVYAAHSAGVSIIDIQNEQPICYIEAPTGFNSVVGNSDNVYLGTSSDGVFYFSKSSIYGTKDELGDISSEVYALSTSYLPSCAEIKSLAIHGWDLAVVTVEGLDVIGMGSGKEFKSTTTSSGITKSFLTSKKEVYYLENSETWSVCKAVPYLCDWSLPTIRHSVGNSFLLEGIYLNDLFITENASLVGDNNTIFVATSSGIYVYDEGLGTTDIYL